MFGTGTPNTAYAQYFIGNSFLNPLTDPKGGLFAANPCELTDVDCAGIFEASYR